MIARRRAVSRRPGRERRSHGEQGAVLVEVVLVAPMLLVLCLGIFELGMMLRGDIVIASSTRSAARVGASSGDAPLADFELLSAFGAAVSNVENATVNYVTVYQVTGSTSTPPAACTTAAAISAHGSAANSCNTYSGADLAAIMSNPAAAKASFGGSCGGGGKDTKWCPSSRVNEQGAANGPDYLGVSTSVTVPTFTKLFGSSKTFTDAFVVRLDPSTLSNGGSP